MKTVRSVRAVSVVRNVGNVLAIAFSVGAQVFAPSFAIAADTAVATMNISGNVPTIFSVSARGVPGDLDLTPSVAVNNRVLGLFHFKYNSDVASMTIKSDTASGKPENSGSAYGWGAGGFKVAIAAGCTSVNATYNTPFDLTQAGIDIKSATAASLTTGIEEDCTLTASWEGTTASLPKAGRYALSITLTMVSN